MPSVNFSQMMPSSTSPSAIIDRSKSPSNSLGSIPSSTSRLTRFQKAGQRSRSQAGRSNSRLRGISPAFSNMEEQIETPSIEFSAFTPQSAAERLVSNDAFVPARQSSEPKNETHGNTLNFRDVLRQGTHSMNHQDDASDAGSDFSESTNVPRRNLRVHDVAALILNKVVGTGIFTTPGLVLALTKDKPTSIALWVIGGVHAMLWYLHPIQTRSEMFLIFRIDLVSLYILNLGQLCHIMEES